MHASLLLVARQFAVSVAMLVPVIPVAFVSMPMNLGDHPGRLQRRRGPAHDPMRSVGSSA